MKESLRALARPLLNFDYMYPMSYLAVWYDEYVKTIRWIGVVSAAILTFTVTLLLGEASSDKHVAIGGNEVLALRLSFVLFGLAILFVCSCLLVTYNWFVKVMHMFVRLAEPRMRADNLVDDASMAEAWDTARTGEASTWGKWSLLLGMASGVCFGLGVLGRVVVAWFVLGRNL